MLVYKQRHLPPNNRVTAVKNAEHVRYIGERVHALKNEKSGNGLFGQFGGQDFSDNFEMEKTQKYVNQISKKGVTVFRGLISFREETAKNLGLETAAQWQNYARYNAGILAERNGIKIENFEYVAAVHAKSGQPHLHVLFWDKNPCVQRQFVEEKIADEIRRELIKSTFSAELKMYAEEKDSALQKVSGIADERLAEIFPRGKRFGFSENLYKKFDELLENLPQSGSLKFDFLPGDYKLKLTEFCGILQRECPPLAENFDRYIAMKTRLAEVFNSRETNYGKFRIAQIVGKARDDVSKKIANRVLKTLKSAKKSERRGQFLQEKNDARHKKIMLKLALSLLAFLQSANGGGDFEGLDAAAKTGDLSENAKRDLAYKNADKSDEWSR